MALGYRTVHIQPNPIQRQLGQAGTLTYAQSLSRSDLAATGASLTRKLKTIMENEPPHPKHFANARCSPSQHSASMAASPQHSPPRHLLSIPNSDDSSCNSPEFTSNFSPASSTSSTSPASPKFTSPMSPMSPRSVNSAMTQNPEWSVPPRILSEEEEVSRTLAEIRETKIEAITKTNEVKQLHAQYTTLLTKRKADWMRLRKQIKLVDECGDSLRTLISQRWTIEATAPPMAQISAPVSPIIQENEMLNRLNQLLKLKLETTVKRNQMRQQQLIKLQRAPKPTIDAIFWVPLHGHETHG